ncbi:ribonuclease Z [Halalkalibacter sp. APA_J-10(15)]|uniref:ribonuclease Z n=1 Tax=unclassified Halalkalibacter TaxID=2893063 RepID=UPI001FF6A4C1|nr:ribonuclease Z [Halalkalibacter sp. APA_J-10(15)]MCK0472065.1 ribonuclease Z [Halalkalibacter sp. APA_J-10(15)]
MEFHFLGTGSGIPSKSRNVSGLAVRFLQRKDVWLFDCGEATQHQLLSSSITLSKISHIFITHLHGDHIYGLPGLLSSRSAQGGQSKLTIYGPEGVKEFIEKTFEVSKTSLGYTIDYVIVKDGFKAYEQGITIAVKQLDHVIESFAYKLIEDEKPGSLLVDKLKNAGISPGPIYKKIKDGEQVTLSNGETIHNADYVSSPEKGRQVVIVGDTRPIASLTPFIENVDLLIHEGTFLDDRREHAKKYGHSTIKEVTSLAKNANVQSLILTHISSRYVDMENELLTEAEMGFPRAIIAYDHMIYKLM